MGCAKTVGPSQNLELALLGPARISHGPNPQHRKVYNPAEAKEAVTSTVTAGAALTSGEMEEEKAALIREIEEIDSSTETLPSERHVRTKVPEVEIHLYRQGRGPIDVFKSTLGGWDRDQLEVRDILDKYRFKSIYAFNPQSGRSVPIRFNSRNGRSLLHYRDGAVVYIDGEPKGSLVKPVTRIILGVALITIMIALVSRDTPKWMKKLNLSGRSIPPWILTRAVIVFTRLRKRTKDFMDKHGW